MSSNGQEHQLGDPGDGSQRGPSFEDPTNPTPPQQAPEQSWDEAWGLNDEPAPGAVWPGQPVDPSHYPASAAQDSYAQQSNPYGVQPGTHGQQQTPYGAQQGQWGAEPNPYAAPAYPTQSLYGQPDPYQQPYGGYGMYNHGQPIKSKATAALLAFFIGTFGAHNFYLGKKTTGFAHLALGILGFMIFVVAGGSLDDPATADDLLPSVMLLLATMMVMGNGIWAFVEFIIILVKPEHELGR
ncbi:MAG: NINE protein [Propionibacteriaceae bacterium]|nr:NINE protein [Propionibacteriaceae bacterium]